MQVRLQWLWVWRALLYGMGGGCLGTTFEVIAKGTYGRCGWCVKGEWIKLASVIHAHAWLNHRTKHCHLSMKLALHTFTCFTHSIYASLHNDHLSYHKPHWLTY
ncbi:hypothetical protein V8C86DRAFT_2822576 [Haematococcus lacustris]